MGNKRSHFPRFFLKHVYAVIILSNPNPAFYILCHRMNNYVRTWRPDTGQICPPTFCSAIIRPDSHKTVCPDAIVSIYKKRKFYRLSSRNIFLNFIRLPFNRQCGTIQTDKQSRIINQQDSVTTFRHLCHSILRQRMFRIRKEESLSTLLVTVTSFTCHTKPRIPFPVYKNLFRNSPWLQIFHKSGNISDKVIPLLIK